MYKILRINHTNTLPTLISALNESTVDEVLGYHETTFTDSPINNGLREYMDEMYSSYVVEEVQKEMLEEIVEQQVQQREAFFDDLVDPSNPDDIELYNTISNELNEWNKVKEEINK